LHIDAYRLANHGEVDDLGVEAALGDSVVVVEWGEAIAPIYPATIVVRISGEGEARDFEVELAGPGTEVRENTWSTDLAASRWARLAVHDPTCTCKGHASDLS